MSYEKAGSTDLQKVGMPIRALRLCREDGEKAETRDRARTFLTANSAALLSTIQDMTTTGENGHNFLKLDSGMTDVLRLAYMVPSTL